MTDDNQNDESKQGLLEELGLVPADTDLPSRPACIMLSVETACGEYFAFPYAYLSLVQFNCDETRSLILYFSSVGYMVEVQGYNLDQLYRDICEHRLAVLRETSKEKLALRIPEDVAVHLIDVKPISPQ